MKSSENIKKQNFSIKDLFDKVSILTSFEFKHNKIDVNYNIGKDVDTKVVFGEFTILLQVIVNIIENAIDSYNGESGELYLDSFLTEKENKNYIVIKVEDKGSGIKEDVLEKLLNQMYTTKGSKGTGIGLYLSNILLKSKFGGFLEIESEIGEGTKVFAYVEDNY
jgi:signal transduction histidine kinase